MTVLLETPFYRAIGVFIALLAVVVLSEFLQKRRWLNPEQTRNLVHILVGICVSIFPYIFTDPFYPILLGSIFTILNLVSWKLQLAKGMHTAKSQSLGTVFFPLAFVVLVAAFWSTPIVITLSMLILALADPIASWIGQKFGQRSLQLGSDRKTVAGSIAFFVVTVLIVGSGLLRYDPSWVGLLIVALVATLATTAELVSWRGSDNFTIPLLAAAALHLCLRFGPEQVGEVSGWFGLAGLIAFIAWKLKSLTMSGAIGAFVVGGFIFSNGWQWALPLILFFVSGSILSKLHPQDKAARTIYQVLANGGFAMLIAIATQIWPGDLWYPLYLAVIASATADTWATELGRLSKQQPISIWTGQKIPSGSSGGITVLGTLAALAGAIAMVSIGAQMVSMSRSLVVILVVCSFLSSLVDSLLGATVQGQREPGSTVPWPKLYITNSLVNALALTFAVVMVLILYYINFI